MVKNIVFQPTLSKVYFFSHKTGYIISLTENNLQPESDNQNLKMRQNTIHYNPPPLNI